MGAGTGVPGEAGACCCCFSCSIRRPQKISQLPHTTNCQANQKSLQWSLWHAGWLVDAARQGQLTEAARSKFLACFALCSVLVGIADLYCWREVATRCQTLVVASHWSESESPFIKNLGSYHGTLILRKPHMRKMLYLLYQSSIAFQYYLQKVPASGPRYLCIAPRTSSRSTIRYGNPNQSQILTNLIIHWYWGWVTLKVVAISGNPEPNTLYPCTPSLYPCIHHVNHLKR